MIAQGQERILLCGLGQGDLFITLREGSAQPRLGEGLMPRYSPGPVAAQPRWTLADPPHSLSCFPREG